MIILLTFMLLVGVGFAIYGLSGPQIAKAKPKKSKNNFKEIKFEDTAKHDETGSLKSELQNALEESVRLKQESVILKGKDAEYLQEISRREEWVKKAEESANKSKEENIELEKKFLAKENELQAEFSKNVDLSRQLREAKAKADTLEKDCFKLSSQLQAQKIQIEKLVNDYQDSSKQIQEHSKTITDMKKKSEQSEWVSKVDFNKLNDEYTKLEEELDKKEEEIRRLRVAHVQQDKQDEN